jgi:hypothetical protein
MCHLFRERPCSAGAEEKMGPCSESIGMVFNRSGNAGFFLTLEDTDSKRAGVVLNPGEPAASEPEPIAPATETQPVALATPAAVATPAAAASGSAVLPAAEAVATTTEVKTTGFQTTAEAIAAELAAAEAARPAVPLTTFAPDNLMPGSALRPGRRRPGASMKGFRTIAGDLFKA